MSTVEKRDRILDILDPGVYGIKLPPGYTPRKVEIKIRFRVKRRFFGNDLIVVQIDKGNVWRDATDADLFVLRTKYESLCR